MKPSRKTESGKYQTALRRAVTCSISKRRSRTGNQCQTVQRMLKAAAGAQNETRWRRKVRAFLTSLLQSRERTTAEIGAA